MLDSTGWRGASADEMEAARVDEQGQPAGDVSVIAIPRHLLKRWWNLAESGDGDPTHINPGFESYAREIAEYFNYKSWPLPTDAVMEVAVSDDVTSVPQPSRATRFSRGVGTLLAVINLGDENLGIALGAEPAQVGVILEPGEGVMLPAGGILWKLATLPGSDLAVTLLIGRLSTD